MLDMHHPVEGLRPAEYNPRAITPDALQLLQYSLHTLGFAKPIIVKPDGLIIAGHQRTKAARAIGLSDVPAWVISAPMPPDDEAQFNQLHNGTDLEFIDSPVYIRPGSPEELRRYIYRDGKDVRGNFRSAQANTRQLVAELLTKYGNWGACVATLSGNVVSSPHYALACAQIGMPVRTYYIEDDLEVEARKIFSHQYGAFSYEHLPRHTYIQSLAQPFRLRSGEAKDQKSDLYEKIVRPRWQPRERLLDFGCGQADYLRMFQANGRRASGIEFFHRDGAQLDKRTVHHMIKDALGQWSRYGGFDLVVCDSVLNSVDSLTAESDVITCVHTFAKPGGRLYFSGRSRERVMQAIASTVSGSKRLYRQVEFLDENGFTAYKRGEGWMFQKFATREELVALFPKFNIENLMVTVDGGKWFASGRKGADLPAAQIEAALRREFDLPWPGGTSVGRAEEAVAAWKLAREKDKQAA
jgi:ParB family chromosome partitioning protein